MRISVEDTSCLVIDYQERIVPAMTKSEELIANSVKLLEGLRILGVPMIITGQYTKGLGLNLPEIFVAAGIEEYIDKLTFSSYEVPEVQNFLHHRMQEASGVLCADGTSSATIAQADGKGKNVLLCGIEAHVCVLQTAIDLKEAGFTPILVTDCISSRKAGDKEIALIRARQEGVLLTTSEAILFELTRKAGTDVFKQISKLVK